MGFVHSYSVLTHVVPSLTAGYLLLWGKKPNDLRVQPWERLL